MRRVDRGKDAGPEGLLKPDKDGKTEFELARSFYADPNRKGNYTFKAYKAADVRARLEELFHGKCAYCESDYSSTAPVDIEHYRPKGAIDGDKGLPGYWWLAMDWLNLLPSCIDCNRKRNQVTPDPSVSLVKAVKTQRDKLKTRTLLSGKKDAFPISGTRSVWQDPAKDPQPSLTAEKPLLLNPAIDNPADHLVFYVDKDVPLSLVLPSEAKGRAAAERGTMSIQVYGLNRMGLVQARTRVLRQLEFLTDLGVELYATADDRYNERRRAKEKPYADKVVKRLNTLAQLVFDQVRKMAEPDAPYSALADAWIARFVEDLQKPRR